MLTVSVPGGRRKQGVTQRTEQLQVHERFGYRMATLECYLMRSGHVVRTMVEECSHGHAASKDETAWTLTGRFEREALPEHGVFVGLPAYLSSNKRNLKQIVNVTSSALGDI